MLRRRDRSQVLNWHLLHPTDLWGWSWWVARPEIFHIRSRMSWSAGGHWNLRWWSGSASSRAHWPLLGDDSEPSAQKPSMIDQCVPDEQDLSDQPSAFAHRLVDDGSCDQRWRSLLRQSCAFHPISSHLTNHGSVWMDRTYASLSNCSVSG